MSGDAKRTAEAMHRSAGRGHGRLLLAGVSGLAAYVGAQSLGAPAHSQVLIGWLAGAAVYLGLAWRLILTSDGEEVRRRAAQQDEGLGALSIIVLALSAASLVAIVLALMGTHQGPAPQRILVAGLAVATLMSSWLLLQTVFVLHYAHRHFGDEKAKGFDFPGEPARNYLDFVYLSFCIGATFQVSDTVVKTQALRNLVTAHGALAYVFNTAILALGINIIAGLIGG